MAKGKVTQEQAAEGKRLLSETVSLLIGLCKSVAPNRLREETLPYRTEQRLTIKIKSRIKMKKSTGSSSLNSTENSEEPFPSANERRRTECGFAFISEVAVSGNQAHPAYLESS